MSALGACIAPARTPSRVDPIATLRAVGVGGCRVSTEGRLRGAHRLAGLLVAVRSRPQPQRPGHAVCRNPCRQLRHGVHRRAGGRAGAPRVGRPVLDGRDRGDAGAVAGGHGEQAGPLHAGRPGCAGGNGDVGRGAGVHPETERRGSRSAVPSTERGRVGVGVRGERGTGSLRPAGGHRLDQGELGRDHPPRWPEAPKRLRPLRHVRQRLGVVRRHVFPRLRGGAGRWQPAQGRPCRLPLAARRGLGSARVLPPRGPAGSVRPNPPVGVPIGLRSRPPAVLMDAARRGQRSNRAAEPDAGGCAQDESPTRAGAQRRPAGGGD
jgi:hypothetical protein